MTQRKTYIYEFLFYIEENSECENFCPYYFEREVSDELAAAYYAFIWLKKYQDEFGYCFNIVVREKDNPTNILLDVARNWLERKKEGGETMYAKNQKNVLLE